MKDSFVRDSSLNRQGEKVDSHRWIIAFGEKDATYIYAGSTRTTREWTPTLKALAVRMNALCSHTITFAIVNLYEDGNDYLGWHSDNESDLVSRSTIASISLGATRKFEFQRISKGKEKLDKDPLELSLEHGSLLLMKKDTQKMYKHRVPRQTEIKKPRINITFRAIKKKATSDPEPSSTPSTSS